MKDKTVYDAELDIDAPVIDFRAIVEEISGVAPETQKLKFKEKINTSKLTRKYTKYKIDQIFNNFYHKIFKID